jgi:hypothetical protein
MKAIVRAMIEEQVKNLEVVISMLCDDLDLCVEALEELIEVPEEAPEPETKTKQELLEDELEELLNKHCISANFYTTDNLTIAAVMVEGVPFPNVGVAKCCPTDEFNETEGDIIALKRALGLPVDPEQYGTPKFEKDCDHCKYEDLDATEYPCNKCCESDDDDPEYWEAVGTPDKVAYDGPLDFDHDCGTCKHDKDTAITEEPCKTCLNNGRAPICWEPIEVGVEVKQEALKAPKTPLIKRCSTCEFHDTFILNEPCFTCACDEEKSRPNWEPSV